MAATKPQSASRPVPSWVFLLALCGIALVSRLPQLLSKDLLLDGDECILGLMATVAALTVKHRRDADG